MIVFFFTNKRKYNYGKNPNGHKYCNNKLCGIDKQMRKKNAIKFVSLKVFV